MSESIIAKKSFDFAVDIVNLYRELVKTKKEFVLSKQLLRAATSIGANVSEALKGQSKRDFLAKMYIALKEAYETEYWIRLLTKTNYLDKKAGESLLSKCKEICKILNSITKTVRNSTTIS
ncbi:MULTISPECIES: four helix bundle protein [Eubacteriales]|uniref:Four helix bundle protein n=1 Tax=Clostridium isatidis TaxID=182773 RepID=A0A343JA44_9CLOT|nr:MULTISPECIES: four helix bundle protein [Eubacteriales]ASW42402.1 four helix bundle protein [Clostridium isatidis]MBU5454761.1 four helix bundle protein [Caproiciproducens sp. MSJ-32]MBU5454762.1 four helix bundle protein [Caproiciproducens sp. MSJ-32]NLZ35800.1 four helix bundle protein [Clostridiales bacterium]